MCFEAATDGLASAANDTPATGSGLPSPAQILGAGMNGGGSTLPARQSGVSKAVNSPISQGAASTAGVALAPATAGLSLLIPVATKLLGGLLTKKPKNFGPPPITNSDAGLNALASRSFGGL